MKTYVINLEKDADRLRFMTGQLDALGVDFERIAAIAAEDISPDMIGYLRSPRSDGFTVRWKNSEAACFFSHGKAWERIANGDDSHALILEDDMHLSGILERFVADHDWIPDDAQIIRFESSTNRLLLDAPLKAYGRNVARLLSTSWCAGAYVLSRETARYLVALEHPLYDHVDAYLFSHERSPLARTLRTYQVFPAVAIQDKFINKFPLFKSNIETEEDQTAKPRRNVASALLKTIHGYRRIGFKA